MKHEQKELFSPVFDDSGLLTAVVVDKGSRQVLMVACMNSEALAKTLETGFAHFFSRKRQRLWKKGETSGNVLVVQGIYVDCDQDCIQLVVEILGGGNACHTGRRSCFYRILEHGHLKQV